MTGSPLRRFVITPMLISAGVFGVVTLPLALLGNQEITIQTQDEPLFHGKLRDPDVATPYLFVATLLSLAAGTASVAVNGWQQSHRKSAEVTAKLSSLTQDLEEREKLLESIKLSEDRLAVSGLASFLDEDLAPEPPISTHEDVQPQPVQSFHPQQVTQNGTPPLQEQTKPQPITPQSEISSQQPPTVQPIVIKTLTVEPQSVTSAQPNAKKATHNFPSAQNYMAYASRKPGVDPNKGETQLSASDVENLQNQLQQMKAQMDSLQKLLAGGQKEQGPSSQNRPNYLHIVNS